MRVYKETESEDKVMSYGDIYDEFCEKFPNSHAEDYRPACSLHIPQLMKDIPNGIVVWLKDGSKVVYIAESEDKNDRR
jgi:hypothetical protein